METKKTKVSRSEIYSVIDLSNEVEGLSKDLADDLKKEVGELLVEEILGSLANVKTPISGGEYKRSLSKDYKKKKIDETGSGEANLDLEGDLINSIDYQISGNTIKLGVFDAENAGKADGHNNFSGLSKIPTRQFLPREGQTFRRDIERLVAETVNNFKADNIELDEKELEKIETKSELYDYLKSELGIESKSKLRDAVLGSKQLTETLEDFDLLDSL